MKIDRVEILNFRGIRRALLADLGHMIVIAGQNGSGKSCVLDAIRLLKSVYGGYQANEWHHWMGEFQVNFQNSADLKTLMNDQSQELRIECHFSLHPDERKYVWDNSEELVRQTVWRTMFPDMYGWSSFYAAPLAAQLRNREPEIDKAVKEQLVILKKELEVDKIVGRFTISKDLKPMVSLSKALEVLFGVFRPSHIGVIDYHGPHRTYGREQLSGINLNLDALEQQRSQHALYNYGHKYANVKSEMAGSYIKELIAGSTGEAPGGHQSMAETLKELFRTFFPDKEFLGPQPTPQGNLTFPVKIGESSIHDLNELSAGEKEVLYGYLRLRSSAPKYSVILMDEPELHLNPRLIRGLPAFYHRHLGRALENQVWLITHSDALLREAVGQDGYSVFHMHGLSIKSSGDNNQAVQIIANDGLEKAVIDLVGDLAAYRPNAKLIIFEGENSQFDQRMTAALFPALAAGANLVSAGHKARVRGLHTILKEALDKGDIPMRIFSIVDADSDEGELNPIPDSNLSWDAYHIENYLIEESIILKILKDLQISKFSSEGDLVNELRNCARETLPELIRHRLRVIVNKEVISAISLSSDPKSPKISEDMFSALSRSSERISELIKSKLSIDRIREEEDRLRAEYENDLNDGKWKKKFRGRDILRIFVSRIGKVNYEVFRDLIVATMRDSGYQPAGMKRLVEAILEAKQV